MVEARAPNLASKAPAPNPGSNPADITPNALA